MRTTTALDATKLTGTVDEARLATLDATKLTGTIANARISEASVTQHVTATDLTPVRQDIAMLALYNAVSDNRAAYNLPKSFIDQFEDDTGLTTQTDVDRNTDGEYVSSISTSVGAFSNDANTKLLLHMEDASLSDSSSTGHTTTITGNAVRSSTQARFGTYSVHMTAGNITLPAHADFNFGTGDFTVEGWVYYNATIRNNEPFFDSGAWGSNNYDYVIRMNATAGQIFEYGLYNGSSDRYKRETTAGAFPVGSWQHIAVSRTSGATTLWRNGLAVTQAVHQGFVGDENMTNGSSVPRIGSNTWLSANAYFDEFRISNVGRYTAPFTPNEVSNVSATGTLISDQQTAPALTKMSGVVLVKDGGSSTTVMGDHLKIYFCATGAAASFPSAWVEATSYTAVTAPFSTGVTMYKLGETTVPSGTLPTIRAVWASQTDGGFESQLHGWAMNY